MRNVLALVLVLACTTLAGGTDQPIGAVKLVLKRSSSGVEKLTFVSKDPSFLFPAIGGSDDPSLVAASVTVVSPLEPPATFAIPPGVGKPGWRLKDATTLDAYRFANGDAPAGPSVVRSASFRQNRSLKIMVRDIGLALAAPQGSVGIRVTTGALRNCARFDASTIIVDEPNRFVARGALAGTIADCSDAALGAPPSCGNGVVDGTEECDGAGCDALVNGCFPPGDPNECTCCSTIQCSEVAPIVPCCPGQRCAVFFQIGAPGVGDCTTSPCNGTGYVCDGSVPCCAGLACGPVVPGFPVNACQPPPTTSTTSTTLPPPGCGNGVVDPGEQCDGTCSDPIRPDCVPPGDPAECTCCNATQCYDGGIGELVECCPGLACAHYPPIPGQGFGLGQCASTCAPYGTECGSNGLTCCMGTCLPINPSFPYFFCQ